MLLLFKLGAYMAAKIGMNDFEKLQLAKHEIVKKNGFYDFVSDSIINPKKFSGIKIHELRNLFESSTTWTPIAKSSGHVAFLNPITKIKVEFPAHKTRKSDGVLPKGSVHHIVKLVQDHMNILANDIYEIKNWEEEPDYGKALQNFYKKPKK
jgi:hypothetical protein